MNFLLPTIGKKGLEYVSKSMGIATKGIRKGTCKQGERADLTDCVPASETGSSSKGKASDQNEGADSINKHNIRRKYARIIPKNYKERGSKISEESGNGEESTSPYTHCHVNSIKNHIKNPKLKVFIGLHTYGKIKREHMEDRGKLKAAQVTLNPHVWNENDGGEIVDTTSGTKEARTYQYFGREVVGDDLQEAVNNPDILLDMIEKDSALARKNELRKKPQPPKVKPSPLKDRDKE